MKTQCFIQLVGYLGNDPVCKTTANGSLLVRLRLATDYYRRGNDENVIRKVSWHNILAWDKLAEKIPGNYIKGSHVLVQGELCYRTYPDDRGHKYYITEIRAGKILNLDR